MMLLPPNTLSAMSMAQWTPLRALLDIDEMHALCTQLPLFSLYQAGNVLPIGKGIIPLQHFLSAYAEYISALRQGKPPPYKQLRHALCAFWSAEKDSIAVHAVSTDQQVLSPALPLIQLQPHAFCYSPFDQSFRSMVFGPTSMPWGLQWSHPQVYQHPTTQAIYKVAAEPKKPNTLLFRTLQRWMRHHTQPLQVSVEGKRTCLPIRIGPNCLKWIHHYPQLNAWNIQIVTPSLPTPSLP